MAAASSSALVSIGYEGRDVVELIGNLVAEKVTVLVDVRLNPISRKPGLSKVRLRDALEKAGISYVHHRELGNPKENRLGFREGAPEAIEKFRGILHSAEAEVALNHVSDLLAGAAVALLCFERDHASCHRGLVAEAIQLNGSNVRLVKL